VRHARASVRLCLVDSVYKDESVVYLLYELYHVIVSLVTFSTPECHTMYSCHSGVSPPLYTIVTSLREGVRRPMRTVLIASRNITMNSYDIAENVERLR
jgi:hypothetical protein